MPGSPLSAPREVRFRWYRQVEKYEKTIEEACVIFEISRKTYHKWYRRDHGYGSNEYHPRRMHPQTKLTPRIKEIVREAKEKYNFGPLKMKLYLEKEHRIDVSTTAIYKFFKRNKLIRKPQKKQPWYRPMKKRIRVRQPGQNVQLDVKYVPGTDTRWEYQYRFIDVLTNMQFVAQTLVRSAETSIMAFKQAEKFFPFSLQGIQTDNGGEFRGVFADYLEERKIIHRFIPKRSAPWNGKVERANRSVDDEFYLNTTKPWTTVEEYTKWYNARRPHLGIGMRGQTPNERYQSYVIHREEQSPLKVNDKFKSSMHH